ncbi:hypothetical protein M8C21_014017 [Ambrosia artemisiifolia]|uniref:Uncharacterized protein n=1 Tax=Ambrosia artemisiifolia TaxID=4212 RepID=A0AAD5G9P3_AMBAR|nr:hypothetical protein M8C21_014017 [Ambrosia artemisiifolia]
MINFSGTCDSRSR